MRAGLDKRALGRSSTRQSRPKGEAGVSFRPPPDFTGRFPNSVFHFHLFFYDCLVGDDVRKHIMDTSREHHLRQLRATPQGALNECAKGKRAMPALTANARTRASESFAIRYIA